MHHNLFAAGGRRMFSMAELQRGMQPFTQFQGVVLHQKSFKSSRFETESTNLTEVNGI